MVRKSKYLTEANREAAAVARSEKVAFSRRAVQHILEHSNEDAPTNIPSMEVNNPSRILRLWLEVFPDLATNSLGKHATRVALHVEERGANPLVVRFDPTDKQNTPD